jgi:hypothetical protein
MLYTIRFLNASYTAREVRFKSELEVALKQQDYLESIKLLNIQMVAEMEARESRLMKENNDYAN